MKQKKYGFAGITVRLKAMVGDVIFLVVMMFVITAFFDSSGDKSEGSRIIAFVCLFFLYEPLMVAVFGGTIGHLSCKLRVREEANQQKKINFFIAIIRFLVKAFFGIFSLVSIGVSEKSKGLHDMVVGSVVLDLNIEIKDLPKEAKDNLAGELKDDEVLDN